mmetsp:Transcript_25650/g.102281  ORF Transcript_25650/g.102281 Transcript_25650/m.102281 type:complete len:420 (+) Transcript_25650:2641-3900(+)
MVVVVVVVLDVADDAGDGLRRGLDERLQGDGLEREVADAAASHVDLGRHERERFGELRVFAVLEQQLRRPQQIPRAVIHEVAPLAVDDEAPLELEGRRDVGRRGRRDGAHELAARRRVAVQQRRVRHDRLPRLGGRPLRLLFRTQSVAALRGRGRRRRRRRAADHVDLDVRVGPRDEAFALIQCQRIDVAEAARAEGPARFADVIIVRRVVAQQAREVAGEPRTPVRRHELARFGVAGHDQHDEDAPQRRDVARDVRRKRRLEGQLALRRRETGLRRAREVLVDRADHRHAHRRLVRQQRRRRLDRIEAPRVVWTCPRRRRRRRCPERRGPAADGRQQHHPSGGRCRGPHEPRVSTTVVVVVVGAGRRVGGRAVEPHGGRRWLGFGASAQASEPREGGGVLTVLVSASGSPVSSPNNSI